METKGLSLPPLDELELFRKWPSGETKKVPSQLSYSKTLTNQRQWGHSIDTDSLVLIGTKLELQTYTPTAELKILKELVKGLDLVTQIVQDDGTAQDIDIPKHLSKNSEQIVSDYLSKVVREWYMWMKGQREHIFSSVPLDLVMTYPAVSCTTPATCDVRNSHSRIGMDLRSYQ